MPDSWGETEMTDIEKKPTDGGTSLVSLFSDGGLPQILLGPAGNSISRLLGIPIDILSAWGERVSQGIRDKTEARSRISKVFAEEVAQRAVGDPEIMERAMNNMLSRQYKIQENKDAIVGVAISDLKNNSVDINSAGPSEDFLNRFERHAEDATSDELRLMYGRILSGEIRKPGSISPATLHFVSMLEQETTGLIQRLLPYSFSEKGGGVILDLIEPALSVAEEARLEQCNFCTPRKQISFHLSDQGTHVLRIGNGKAIFLFGSPHKKVKYTAAILSIEGRDLVKILNVDFDIQAFADFTLKHKDVYKIQYGNIITVEGKQMKIAKLAEYAK